MNQYHVSVTNQIPPIPGIVILLGLLLMVSIAHPVSADNYVGGIPLDIAEEGTVSGGVWIDSYYGMSNTAPVTIEQQYSLPEYSAIRWARLYVAVYCGNMENNYAGTAMVDFDGGTGYSQIGTESLNVPYTFPGKDYNPPSGEYGTGPVYVNDHCVRVTSDYLMWYDVTYQITGEDVKARVSTTYTDAQFDGRIKIITLVVAYDDGDGDTVRYWILDGQDTDSYHSEEELGEDYIIHATFPTGELPDEEEWTEAWLQNVHLASEDATYTLNEDEPTDLIASGGRNYCGYNKWDVAGIITPWEDATLSCDRTDSFYKIFLAALSVRYPEQETGTLTVTSSPPGATILIDGEETEYATNCTIPGMAVGSYAVSVTHPSYEETDEEWIDITADTETMVNFNLRPLTGSLSVTSEPSGAQVFIDGEDSGHMTDAFLEDVVIGDHDISVRLGGYTEAHETVTVTEGETTEVSFTLTPESSTGGNGGDDDDGDTDATGYSGKELTTLTPVTFKGEVATIPFGTYTGLIERDTTSRFTLNVPRMSSEEPVLARLYLYTTWGHHADKKTGTEVDLVSSLDNARITPDVIYTDRKGEGTFDYILSTLCFNVTDAVKEKGAGDYQLSVKNTGSAGEVCALYGGTIVLFYENASAPMRTVWLAEGCDAIIADEAAGISPDAATTAIPFPGGIDTDGVTAADLTVISTAATGKGDDANRVFFNDWEYYNILTGGSSGISLWTESVTPYLRTSANEAQIQSALMGATGDYLENRNALLVLTHDTTASNVPVITSPEDDTPESSGSTPATDKETFTLPTADERLHAAELSSGDGQCTLYIREGTRLAGSGGATASMVTIQQRSGLPGGNPAWTYAFTPADAIADIPLILEVKGDICTSGGTILLKRYDTDSGAWNDAGSTSVEDGVATIPIECLGTYTAVCITSEASTEDGTGGGVLSGFSDILFAILRFTGISGFLNISDSSDGPEEVAKIPAVASGSPVVPSAEIQVAEETFIDYRNGTYDLMVLSSPPGSLVMLDGVYTGKTTPCILTDTQGGMHSLSVSRTDFQDSEETLTISDDSEIRFDLTPESPKLDCLKFDGYVPYGYEDGIGGAYVTSHPDGADIYLDGRNTGLTTPEVIVGLKGGRHTIKVRDELNDYPCDSKKIWVYPGGITPVTFDQAYITTKTVTFTSDEYENEDFTINGRYPQYTFPTEADVSSGVHPYITILHNGSYISQEGSLWRDGDTVRIRPEEMTFGTVQITSEPEGAEIFVDGFPTGLHTPYLIENVSEGMHTISVSLPGHLPDEEILHLVPGIHPVDEEISFLLEPYPYGSLSITSEPEGAKVYLNNKYTGKKTPAVFRYMDIGSIPVRLVSAEGTVTVENAVIGPYETAEYLVNITQSE